MTISYPGKEGWEEIKVPVEPITTPIQPTPTPALTLSPTPPPKPTPTPTPSPTPTPLPPTPPPDDGNNPGIFLVIAVVAGVVLFSFKPIMIAYYTWKMNKWEKEGYDVSKLKEVLKR